MDIQAIKNIAFYNPQSSTVELDASTLASLKKMSVDIFDNVYIGDMLPNALILCVDIRGFSNFLCAHDEKAVFSLITSFTSNFLSCVNQVGYGCSYYKLLGDGALVIWDKATVNTLTEAVMVFQTYTEFLNDELFKPYPELGLGGALVMDKVYKYEISAEASALKYRDYVGYGINLACRLQGLAQRSQLIVNKRLAHVKEVHAVIKDTPHLFKEVHQMKGLVKEDKWPLYFFSSLKTGQK